MKKKYSHAKYIGTFCVSLLFALLLNMGSAFAADFNASGNVSVDYDGPVSSLTHIDTLEGAYTVVPIAEGQTIEVTMKEGERRYYIFYRETFPTSNNFLKVKTISGVSPLVYGFYVVSNSIEYCFVFDGDNVFPESTVIDLLKTRLTKDYEKKGTGLYLMDISSFYGDCTFSVTLPSLEGAEVSFTPNTEDATVPASVYTGSDGAWSQTGFTDGAAYTVSASKPGYTIIPSVQTITGSSSAADFTAAPDSYPSIVSAVSDTYELQCTGSEWGCSYLEAGNVVNLTVKTSGLNDGTVVAAYLVTSQKADANVAAEAGAPVYTIGYGKVTDNEVTIEAELCSGLKPGGYEFMVMIPGLSTPAYVPLTLLSPDSSPLITDITLSPESMSNKQSGVVTANIQTANVPDYYVTYVYDYGLKPVNHDTVCNVELLKPDGSSVANFDWKFTDNKASVPFNVPDLPAGSYRFKITINTKTAMLHRDAMILLDTPLVAYKDFTVYDAATSNDITGFAAPGQTGASVIDSANHTVSFSMPYGSDVTALKPDITINGASVSPATGADVDFSSPVTYTVTAQNGMRQKWTVTCSVYGESFSYKSITAYSIPDQTGDSTIDAANRTITLEMPDGTDLSSLVASFTVSTGASVTANGATQTSGSTANSFRAPLEYTVTAEDGSTAVWTVYIICNTRQFELSGGSLSQTGSGVTVSVTVAPATGLEHDGTEMVVFQLMKGDSPAGIIAVKRDIQTAQQVQAYFDVEGTGYSVKVFVFDRLTYESGNTQVNLADTILLQ